jgi:hypothetical protein
MLLAGDSVFIDFATEIANGEPWKLLRANNWDEFKERLADPPGNRSRCRLCE